MPIDDRFITLLRSLQAHSDQQDTPRLLSSASYVLTTLSNPLNLTLLTAQLLSAPAIWTRPDGLRTCLRFMGIFQSAALTILRHEDEVRDAQHRVRPPPPPPGQPVTGGNLSRDSWVKAILNGADSRSPRWRHAVVIAGLLLGFEAQERHELSRTLRSTVGDAFVKAVNVALSDIKDGDELEANCITLTMNYVFELLNDAERSRINYDALLPILVGSAFFSHEGYRSAYFLANVDADVLQVAPGKFTWSERSSSYQQLMELSSRPLITGMGPLSRLIAHTVEYCKDPWLIQTMLDDVSAFAHTLMKQWRQTKLSEVDASEEKLFFDASTTSKALPLLWRIMRSCLFASAIVLRSVVGRVVNDGRLASNDVAPILTTQSLKILRNLYFITTRLGSNSFSQYTFVYLASIDILSAYPSHIITLLDEIAPSSLGQIPTHPLDRTLDLYFLNTAEHFTLVLSPQVNDQLLIAAALPYLHSGGNNHLLEIFEAAHSVMLAVLSSPQSADVAAAHLPFYVDALFKVFPQNLSARQFRLAFRTLLRVTTPPSALSLAHPDMPETFLELLHHRVLTLPSTSSRLAPYTGPTPAQTVLNSPNSRQNDENLDERTALVLTLIDSLPVLPPHMLEEWLPLTAELLPTLEDRERRQRCKERFWEVLSGGEMDVDRSQVCIAWWATMGGRELVLFAGDEAGRVEERFRMSGALGMEAEGAGESKL